MYRLLPTTPQSPSRHYYHRLIAGTNLPTLEGWIAWLAKADSTHITFVQGYYTIESKGFNLSRAAAWSCESLRASGVIRTEPVKFKVLDTESFGEYLLQYAVINGVECCSEIQQHQGRHKAGVSETHHVIVNDCDRRLSGVVLPVC